MQSATKKQILAYLLLVAAVAIGKASGNDLYSAFLLLTGLPVRLMADIRKANRLFPYKLELNRSLLINQWLIWWLMYGLWYVGNYLAKLGY